MKIYYAHPMSWYNTPEEAADVAALEAYGEVVNPNQKMFSDAVDKMKSFMPSAVMQVFADYIRTEADVVAFRSFKDGRIGSGVAREVFEALIWGKEVWMLDFERGGELYGKVVVHRYPELTPDQVGDCSVYLGDILTVAKTRDRIIKGKL